MSEDIKPALTPEEWAVVNGTNRHAIGDLWADVEDDDRFHALAALCLRNQPYGFTWEDWKGISAAIGQVLPAHEGTWWVEQLRETAAKVAALLPPTP